MNKPTWVIAAIVIVALVIIGAWYFMTQSAQAPSDIDTTLDSAVNEYDGTLPAGGLYGTDSAPATEASP